MTFYNDRFFPFDETEIPASITGEAHDIPGSSPYWVQLNEIPSSVTATSSFTEVSTVPDTWEFRVDHTCKTGLVECNSAQAGLEIDFDYWGTGSPLNVDTINTLKTRNPLIEKRVNNIWGDLVWGDHFLNGETVSLKGGVSVDPDIARLGPRFDIWKSCSNSWGLPVLETTVYPLYGHYLRVRTSGSGHDVSWVAGRFHNPGNIPIVLDTRFAVHPANTLASGVATNISGVVWGVGFQSWNGMDGNDAAFNTAGCFTGGSTYGTIAFITTPGVGVDNISSDDIHSFHRWTMIYTPGSPGDITIYQDGSLVATLASNLPPGTWNTPPPGSGGEIGIPVLSMDSWNGFTGTADLYVDYIYVYSPTNVQAT